MKSQEVIPSIYKTGTGKSSTQNHLLGLIPFSEVVTEPQPHLFDTEVFHFSKKKLCAFQVLHRSAKHGIYEAGQGNKKTLKAKQLTVCMCMICSQINCTLTTKMNVIVITNDFIH